MNMDYYVEYEYDWMVHDKYFLIYRKLLIKFHNCQRGRSAGWCMGVCTMMYMKIIKINEYYECIT